MANLLRTELAARECGSLSQIGKVIDDTSNRLLCTVMLGVLDIGDRDLRDRLTKVFELRNRLAHGLTSEGKRGDAEFAIQAAEDFCNVVEKYGSTSTLNHPSF